MSFTHIIVCILFENLYCIHSTFYVGKSIFRVFYTRKYIPCTLHEDNKQLWRKKNLQISVYTSIIFYSLFLYTNTTCMMYIIKLLVDPIKRIVYLLFILIVWRLNRLNWVNSARTIVYIKHLYLLTGMLYYYYYSACVLLLYNI